MPTQHDKHKNQKLIKYGKVYFRRSSSRSYQIKSAILLLGKQTGILEVHHANKSCIGISYDATTITLKLIKDGLKALGYNLENRLLTNIKRTLSCFINTTQSTNNDDKPIR